MYRYNAAGTISSVSPNQGPAVGEQLVTIMGQSLGNGSDITAVIIARQPARIISQTNHSVMVITFAGQPGGGMVQVISSSRGSSYLPNGYQYNAGMLCDIVDLGAAVGVIP